MEFRFKVGFASTSGTSRLQFAPDYDVDGNMTLIQTSTGTWSVSYSAENRPTRFENTETGTVVECSYDFKGRRFEKKVTREGSVVLHHRYVYDGYLQIAALDLTRANAPSLWLILWDPSQPTATRPLAIQRYGKWFTYGWDLTKNLTELFGSDGYIKTAYAYDPFGNVSINGATSQDLQWSSEHCDSELGLVYYNFRHYSPNLGRWLSRDPIEEQGGWNLYAFVGNTTSNAWDVLGEEDCTAGATELSNISITTTTAVGNTYVIKNPSQVLLDFFTGLALDDIKDIASRKSAFISSIMKAATSVSEFFKVLGFAGELGTSAGFYIRQITVTVQFKCCVCVCNETRWKTMTVSVPHKLEFLNLRGISVEKLAEVYFIAMKKAATRMVKNCAKG